MKLPGTLLCSQPFDYRHPRLGVTSHIITRTYQLLRTPTL